MDAAGGPGMPGENPPGAFRGASSTGSPPEGGPILPETAFPSGESEIGETTGGFPLGYL